MVIKVVIEGTSYDLDDDHKNLMEYFKEADVLQKLSATEPVILIFYLG
jgi:hypothetical protein